jgi:SAM-dependent methyltransferase
VKEVFPNCELVGLESYPPYQEILRSQNIKVINFDIEHEKIPYPDESVDLIIINQVMEHCKEIWWLTHELTRVLKVGGSLIIGVPNMASLHNRFLLMLGKQPTSINNNSAHVRGYTKKDFIRFLNSGFPGGYKLAGFGGSNFYPFPAFLAKPLATLFPTMAVGIFFHFKKEKKYTNNSFLTYPVEQQLETKFFLG